MATPYVPYLFIAPSSSVGQSVLTCLVARSAVGERVLQRVLTLGETDLKAQARVVDALRTCFTGNDQDPTGAFARQFADVLAEVKIRDILEYRPSDPARTTHTLGPVYVVITYPCDT